jgi:hypothetical protein
MDSIVDKRLFFLYRKATTLLIDVQRRHRDLITCEATIDDNSTCTLPHTTIKSLQLLPGEVVLLEGQKGKDKLAVVLIDDALEYGYVYMTVLSGATSSYG